MRSRIRRATTRRWPGASLKLRKAWSFACAWDARPEPPPNAALTALDWPIKLSRSMRACADFLPRNAKPKWRPPTEERVTDMCGILGAIGAHAPQMAERVPRAADLMRHRGPDDWGVYTDDHAA